MGGTAAQTSVKTTIAPLTGPAPQELARISKISEIAAKGFVVTPPTHNFSKARVSSISMTHGVCHNHNKTLNPNIEHKLKMNKKLTKQQRYNFLLSTKRIEAEAPITLSPGTIGVAIKHPDNPKKQDSF